MSIDSTVGSEAQVRWVIAGVIIGLALCIPMSWSMLFDDAYIHARIARNLLTYCIPVFNEGQVFKVGSSTGYVLILAAIAPLFGMIKAIRAIEMVAIFFSCVGLFHLAGVSGNTIKRPLLIIACTLPNMLWAAYGGMETPIVCMLLVGTAIAYRQGLDWLVVLLVAFSTWFRFEAILLLALCLYYYVLQQRKFSLALFALPFLGLIATDMTFFGSIIPHAAKVKSLAYDLSFNENIGQIFSIVSGSIIVFWIVVFALTLHLLPILQRRLRIEFSDLFLLFACGVLAAWLVGRSIIFAWYYSLFSFPFALYLLFRSPTETDAMNRWLRASSIYILLSFGFQGLVNLFYDCNLTSRPAVNLRVTRYLDIASALYTQCPDCTLASSEIGGLGYAFKGHVYDAFGLGDPTAVKYHPMKTPEERASHFDGAIPPAYIAERNPDFVVSMPNFSMAFRTSEIRRRYHVYDCPFTAGHKTVIWGDSGIEVFSKRPLPSEVLGKINCAPVGAS